MSCKDIERRKIEFPDTLHFSIRMLNHEPTQSFLQQLLSLNEIKIDFKNLKISPAN